MTFQTAPYPFQKIILIINILIVIITVFDLLLCFKRKSKFYFCLIIEGLIFIVSSFLLVSLLAFNKSDSLEETPAISIYVINLPLWLIIIVEFICFSSSISLFIFGLKMNKKQISNNSIIEGFNYLPCGICFYEKNGLLRLANIKINDLCFKITNRLLLNGEDFWKAISLDKEISSCKKINIGNQPVIQLKDGSVYSFKRIEHLIDESYIYEIIAVDITTKYNLSTDLSNKNKELEVLNTRMLEYGENIDELIAKKEILNAKIHIHDELGALLLTTKKILDETLNNEKKKKLLDLWKNGLINLNGAKEKKNSDTYNGLYMAAKAIGVSVDIVGEKPKDKKLKNIAITAIVECITNTVKHAKGNAVYVEIVNNGPFLEMTVSNNGEPPKEKIIEGGGLSSLRVLVEREAGKMTIEIIPTFKLKIIMPKEKQNERRKIWSINC